VPHYAAHLFFICMRTLKLYLFLLITLFCSQAVSQNLIRNGSFEELDSCPKILLFKHLLGWNTGYGILSGLDPDAFNTCTGPLVIEPGQIGYNRFSAVPKNQFGYSYPRTGNGYVGLGYVGGYREYIFAPLVLPLTKGDLYCISLYVSLAEISIGCTDALTAFFPMNEEIYTDALGYTTYCPPDSQQVWLQPGFAGCDTSGWVKLSGTYIAKGGEQLIGFGFCHPFNRIFGQWKELSHNQTYTVPVTYVYIDDVSLYNCNEPTFPAWAGLSQYICPGVSLKFGGENRAGYLYRWYKPNKPNDTLSTNAYLELKATESQSYVLEQIDYKWEYTYDTVKVEVSEKYCNKPGWKIYPNPGHGEFTIAFDQPIMSNGIITLYDVTGRLVFRKSLSDDTGEYESHFYINTLAPGAYMCRLLFSGKHYGVQLLIKTQ
jgi:hypothetical protein